MLNSDGTGGSATIRARIRSGTLNGVILGEVVQNVSLVDTDTSTHKVFRFDFLAPVPLTPGTIHVLEVEATAGAVAWRTQYLGDPPGPVEPGYPGGSFVRCSPYPLPVGTPETCDSFTQHDFFFVTYAGITAPLILTTCGDTITSNAILVADLDCTGTTGTVLTIGANNVYFDGQGHKILVPNATLMVGLTGRTGVSILNVDLSGVAGNGITISGGGRTLIPS